MKFQYLLGILIILLIVAPASAIKITAEPLGVTSTTHDQVTQLTYDGSPEGLGIQRIGIDAPIGTTINFVITYGLGTTVSGSCVYTNSFVDPITGTGYVRSQISLGGETSDYEYFSNNHLGRFYVSGYAVNDTPTPNIPGFVIYGSTFGLSTIQNDFVFYPVASGSDGVMYKVQITSDKPIKIAIMTNPREQIAEAKSKSLLDQINEWVTFAIQIGGTIKDIGLQTFYWLKFFLWDNLIMTVALYIAITGAMAFGSTKDVFKAIKKFFGYQRALFEFILSMWQRLIDIIDRFRNIFRL
jgi:hypothetical protein